MSKRKRLVRLQKAKEAVSPHRQLVRLFGAHLSSMERVGVSPSAFKPQILEATRQKWTEMVKQGKLDIQNELATMESSQEFLETFARADITMEDFRKLAEEFEHEMVV